MINSSIKKNIINNYVEKIPCASIENEFTSPGLQSDSYFEHKTSSFYEDDPTDELEFSQKNHAKRIYITSQKRHNPEVGVMPTQQLVQKLMMPLHCEQSEVSHVPPKAVAKSNKSSVSNIFNSSNEIKDFPVQIQETLKRFVKKRKNDLNGLSDK